MINPNGVSLADKALALKLMCEFILSQDSDYNGFMEHNLDTLCGKVTRIIHETVRKHFTHSKVTLASSYTPAKNYFKPGGTISLIQGIMVDCIIESGSNEYG
eukprot:13249301-Ditylum_brightwellii.AAC.1